MSKITSRLVLVAATVKVFWKYSKMSHLKKIVKPYFHLKNVDLNFDKFFPEKIQFENKWDFQIFDFLIASQIVKWQVLTAN